MADIITVDDYKAYVAISSNNRDAKLAPIVAFINKYIHNYCQTQFEPTVVTGFRTTSCDGRTVLLPNAPVISVEEVRRNYGYLDENDAWVTEVYPAIQYNFDPDVGLLSSYFTFSTDNNGMEVDYTYGHTAIPDDLKLAALEWVSFIDKGKFTKSKSLGNGQSIDYGQPELIPSHVKIALDMYKVTG